ncbi:hypothetical protein [Acidocella aminolytica]|uniref:hypothetical protein n=1 Tax=Acidocella aminolytica TaxID=33998 RepID=UPI00223118E3|nr:hypothetical protein [Acidocella aminolytica]
MIAIDPFMHHHINPEKLPFKAKEPGLNWIELSPCEDFLEWFKAPPSSITASKPSGVC